MLLTLTWVNLILWALRHAPSIPISRESTSRNQTAGPGPRFYKTIQIQEEGMAAYITTLEGEMQAFYKYDDEKNTQPYDDISPINNDGAVNTNGTPTLIPMRTCPAGFDPLTQNQQHDYIHFAYYGVANNSRFDWDEYGAGLPSPCPRTTTSTTTAPSDEAGKDKKPPGGLIHFLFWTTIIGGITY